MSSKIQPPSLTVLADKLDLETAAERADILPPQSAAIMEVALEHNPLDILNRARLLAFYAKRETLARSKNVDCESYCDLRTKHILWFIKNVPDCVFAGDFYLALDKVQDKANYQKVAKAWLAAADEAPENTQIKVNAALYFCKQEPVKALKLLNEVLDIEPDNPWVLEIADFCGFENLLALVPEKWCERREFELLDESKQASIKKEYRNASLHSFFLGDARHLSAVTVATLQSLLLTYPDDITARVMLLGFYLEKSTRANLLGVDCHAIKFFATHYLWCISHILSISVIDDVEQPPLTKPVRDLLVAGLSWQIEKLPSKSKSRKRAQKLLEKLQVSPTLPLSPEALARRGFRINLPGVLDSIALSPDTIVIESLCPSDTYSLCDWADDSDMAHGALYGSYGWTTSEFVARLESTLSEDSIDFYSRALVMASCHGASGGLKVDGAGFNRLRRQMLWMVCNVPGCSHLEQFYWPEFETLKALPDEVRKSYSELSANTSDSRVLVNAALAHFSKDNLKARDLLKRALDIDPSNALASDLLAQTADKQMTAKQLYNRHELLETAHFAVHSRPLTEDELFKHRSVSEKLLQRFGFVSGAKSEVITKAANDIDDSGALIFAAQGGYTSRSVWTAAQTLNNNPNDVGIRTELSGYLMNSYGCFELGQLDSKLAEFQFATVLWFVQVVPELHIHVARVGKEKFLAGFFALFEARKRQVAAYPGNLAIVESLAWGAPGSTQTVHEGIEILNTTLAKHPDNSALKKRLDFLISLQRPIDDSKHPD